MSILAQINDILEELDVPSETGVFSGQPTVTYCVLTPLTDSFDCFADNRPTFNICEARISVFTKNNYLTTVSGIVSSLIDNGFVITLRSYIGRENDTGYHHYAIDVAKEYIIQEANL